MRALSFLLGAILLAGCTAFKYQANGRPREHLYPPGLYKHDVQLTLPDGKNQRFQGVVSVGEKEIVVVGLSVFQTTAFRLRDDLTTGKQKVEIFAAPLRSYESKLREFYLLLRRLFLLPIKGDEKGELKRANRPDGLPSLVETKRGETEVRLLFDNYDSHQIPLKVRIETEKFSVDIKVTGYEI